MEGQLVERAEELVKSGMFRRSHDLEDLAVMYHLHQNPHTTQRALERKTQMALGLVNQIVSRLGSKGYIRVIQLNHRTTLYHLTSSGRQYYGSLYARLRETLTVLQPEETKV